MEGEPEPENQPTSGPICKAAGNTSSERYLAGICEKTFLSLWSYPGVFRDQGKQSANGEGKEICDLLVIFDQHIIVFSDKHCEFPNSGDRELDWSRWFKRAICKSAEQAWGAERWLRQNPARVFLDRACKNPLPIELPRGDKVSFHLVVVAHGVSSTINRVFNGTGSLIINTQLRGFAAHKPPFHIGDLAPGRTFVHVLDDDSLDTLMENRDTISDFVEYISKREAFLRHKTVCAAGEEELLALYLQNFKNDEHAFVLPLVGGKEPSNILVREGHWEDFQRLPERQEQLRRDRVSYLWDRLIETFARSALQGEQYFVTDGGFKDTERLLRFMGREPRWKRRALAESLLDTLKTTPIDKRRLRICNPIDPGDPFYVFLLFPKPDSVTESHYRTVRRHFLVDSCKVVKLEFPIATDIIGIATEPGLQRQTRSEDAVYVDARQWTEAMKQNAEYVQKEFGILKSPRKTHKSIEEYPRLPVGLDRKIQRNELCPCGSGRKYKRCCLGN